MPPLNLDAQIGLADARFAWCVRNAERSLARGSSEGAAQWALLAGKLTASFTVSFLAHARLEAVLRRAGRAAPASDQVMLKPASPGRRWLHVLTESHHVGGHTALCRRWIELDGSGDRHDLALTGQDLSKASTNLIDAVRASRGEAFCATPGPTPLVEKATWLRSLAASVDAVVLHTHMWDPVPTMAFGSHGGPGVLMLNHADHVYWTGSSVADLVLNLRPSGELMCLQHRGCDRIARLPIPLPRSPVKSGDAQGLNWRRAQGISDDSVVFLTIGTAYKYAPTPTLSFFAAAKRLLGEMPAAHLVAVGPSSREAHWQELVKSAPGRVHAMGVQTDLKAILAAATVYLEGFPFGSLTAMLEAALAAVPPVMAPALCPLPYRSDDFALQDEPVPEDVDAYVARALALASRQITNPASGGTVRDCVEQLHCEPNWRQHLEPIRQWIDGRPQHAVHEPTVIHALNRERLHYWASFQATGQVDNPVSWVFNRALRAGLRPRIDVEAYRALRRARRAGVQAPVPAVTALGSYLLAALPNRWAMRVYGLG